MAALPVYIGNMGGWRLPGRLVTASFVPRPVTWRVLPYLTKPPILKHFEKKIGALFTEACALVHELQDLEKSC